VGKGGIDGGRGEGGRWGDISNRKLEREIKIVAFMDLYRGQGMEDRK